MKEITRLQIENLEPLYPVMLAKALIFLFMGPIAMYLQNETDNFWLRWGIFGLAVTQGHDLTIGLSIVDSVWPQSLGFSYLESLYVYSIIQIIIFKSLSLFLIEYGNAISEGGNIWTSSKRVIFYIFTNPLVLAIFLGIILNICCEGKLPLFLDELLGMLSDAFTPGALFLLRISSHGKISKLGGGYVLTPAFIVTMKQIVLPALILFFSFAWGLNKEDINFNIFYGTMPIAATVPVIAMQYKAEPDYMSSASVLGLLVGAPII